MTLEDIARRLDGQVASSGVNFRAPGHGPGDRSARLLLGPQYPDGFWVFSWAGDPEFPLKDYVRDCLGWRKSRSVKRDDSSEKAQVRSLGHAKRISIAAELYSEAVNLIGTPAQVYLVSRGIRIKDDVSSALRYHPRCPWKIDDRSPTILVPALVGVMTSIRNGEIKAIHRRRLTLDGQKVGKPKMLGIAAGSAIKLDPDEEVTQGLVIGEGVETCLAARQLGYRPVWAIGSAGGIAKFPVLSGIGCLSVLAEKDVTRTNEKAIRALADRWHEANREVFAVDPKVGKDINDALMGGS